MNDKENGGPFSLARCYRNQPSMVLDWIVMILLGLLLLLAPLPFGSIEQPFVFGIEATAALCFLLWMTRLLLFGNEKDLSQFRSEHQRQKEIRNKGPFFHRWAGLARVLRFLTFGRWPKKNPAFDILYEEEQAPPSSYYSIGGYPVRKTGVEPIAIAFLIVILLELIPLPGFVSGLISPSTRRLYESAAIASGIPQPFNPSSLNAFVTFSSFLLYCSYFLIFLTVVNVARRRAFYLVLIYAIVAAAIFQAAYGLYELLSGQQQIFWFKKKYFLNSASGTFINRNHYAVYLGISIPLLMALIGSRFSQLQGTKGNFLVQFLRMIEQKKSRILLHFYLIFVVTLGIGFSFSLTGGAPVLVATALFFYFYTRHTKSHKAYFATAVILATIFFTGILGSERFKEKMQGIPGEVLSERSRFQAWSDTISLSLAFPFTGTGAGTFAEVFPIYRQFGTDTRYSQTHNEYLQQLSENGVIILILCAFFVGVTARQLQRVRAGTVSRFMMIRLGALCSFVLVALHNLVDFSFQIPAIAVTSVVVVGLFFGRYRSEASKNASN